MTFDDDAVHDVKNDTFGNSSRSAAGVCVCVYVCVCESVSLLLGRGSFNLMAPFLSVLVTLDFDAEFLYLRGFFCSY